jgi:hypothetical protein
LLSVAASEAGYDDVSEPEDGLISNEDEVAELVDRTRAELGSVIRNAEQPTSRSGKCQFLRVVARTVFGQTMTFDDS